MTSESRASESGAKSRAQIVVADVLAAVGGGTRAMEAEAMALIGLEQACQQANEAAAELRRAIQAEAVAKKETVQARNGTRQPLREEEKASRAAAKADQHAEREAEKLKVEQAKLAKSETLGKPRNAGAAEKARLAAEDAGRKARAAHLALDTAKVTSETAKAEVRAAQEKAKLAAAQVRSARIADAAAKRNEEGAEENGRKAIEAASMALANEASAKKTLDRAIRALKAIVLQEARAALAAASETQTAPRPQVDQRGASSIVGQPVEKLKVLTSRVTRTAGRLSRVRRRASQDIGEIKMTTTVEPNRAMSTNQPEDELFSGMVRLLIFDPVDHADVTRLTEGLERVEGLRVMSVGGSSGGGTCITVLAEQPVPLVSRLGDLDLVYKTSKRGKDLEVRLRLPEDLSARDEQHVSLPSATR